MNFKKELSGVAAAVAKIMEAELSAKQKKIAKMSEPHHKIDAGDLAKLRAGHKPVKEEQEQVDEMNKTGATPGYMLRAEKKLADKVKKAKEGSMSGLMKKYGGKTGEEIAKMKKEEVEQMEEDENYRKLRLSLQKATDPKHPAHSIPAKQKTPDEIASIKRMKADTELLANKKMAKEEVEQIDESDLPMGRAKDQKTVTVKHKTSGKQLKVVDTPSVREKYKKMDYHPMSEGIEDKIAAAREKAAAAGKPVKEPKKEVSAKRKVEGPRYGGGKQKDEVEESTNLPFTSMLEAYDANGLAAFVRQEEIVAEGDAYDKDRYAVKNGKAVKDNPSHKGSPNYKDQPHHVWANSAEEALQKKMKREEVDNETYKKEMEDQKASMEGKKKQPSVATPSTQGVKNMDEEVEQIEERTLSEPETEKKEKYVKGMKKKLSGFKQRYGERAKEVMYATATRMAKED